jgi:drug/metabolite transporter (DMT)-like permease
MQNSKLLNWGIFILLTLIWGSSFILMKHSKEHLTAAQIAALRIFSAGLIFLPLAIFHLTKLSRQKIFFVILSGITGNLLPAFLYAIAISNDIDSSLAAILNSFTPVFVVIIAIIFFRDRISRTKLAGVVTGFIGVALLFYSWKGIGFENLGYASLILLATVFYGMNVNMVSHFLKEVNPLHTATVSISFMIIPTAFVLWNENFLDLAFEEEKVKFALLEASLLGVVGTAIATALFYILIKRAGGLFASLVTYSIPVVGIILGIADGETVGPIQFACLTIVLTGVYITSRNPASTKQT